VPSGDNTKSPSRVDEAYPEIDALLAKASGLDPNALSEREFGRFSCARDAVLLVLGALAEPFDASDQWLANVVNNNYLKPSVTDVRLTLVQYLREYVQDRSLDALRTNFSRIAAVDAVFFHLANLDATRLKDCLRHLKSKSNVNKTAARLSLAIGWDQKRANESTEHAIERIAQSFRTRAGSDAQPRKDKKQTS
jgi:hypothetical protein